MKTRSRLALAATSCGIAALSLFTPSCGGSASQTKTASGGTTAAGGAAAGGAQNAGGSGGNGTAGGDACVTSADCAWGEINHEILKKSDCMCLFGCPYLPQSKATATRRAQQHATLCDPNRDGAGMPCPIDDCASPGAIACVAGTCQAAAGDAGPTQ